MLSHCAAAEVNAPPEVESARANFDTRVFQPLGTKKCPIFSEKMPQMGFLLHRDF